MKKHGTIAKSTTAKMWRIGVQPDVRAGLYDGNDGYSVTVRERMKMNWDSLKEMWPFVALIGGHIIRTERQRAIFAEKHRAAEEAKAEQNEMLREIREDIKHLLERK